MAAALAILGGSAATQEGRVGSDVALCLLAQQDQPPVYRDVLEETCLQIAGDSCARTEFPLLCLAELRADLRASFSQWRKALPETVEGTRLSQRTYPNRLAQVDADFAERCEPGGQRIEFAQCEVVSSFSALVGLLSVARVANVPLE